MTAPKVPWTSLVVDRLIELRANGYPFDRAWTEAMRRYPPRGRDMGSPRLFEEDGRAVDGLVPFLKRVAEDAYNDTQGPVASGNGPALRHFRVDMVRSVDESGPARRARGHLRQVA
jgi:hypothetical protein